MRHLIEYILNPIKEPLAARGQRKAAALELAEFVQYVQDLGTKVSLLSGGQLGLETILEHHNLVNPDVLKAIAPVMRAKLHPEEAPADAATTSTEDGSRVGEPGRGDVPA